MNQRVVLLVLTAKIWRLGTRSFEVGLKGCSGDVNRSLGDVNRLVIF